jgi:tRNA(Ile)-lysidine synthetase-like protein
VEADRGEIVIRPGGRPAPRTTASDGPVEAVALAERASLGRWQFARVDVAGTADAWSAALPAAVPLTVRAWQPGDRMRLADGGTARRVKRFLADARVRGRDREGWPVVLAGDEIVWIPGVRRSHAATDRPGRPGVLYLCERNG